MSLIRIAMFLVVGLVPALGLGDSVLRVGAYGQPRTLGNPHGSTADSEMYTWAAIFDALTFVDDQAQVHPALALSWEPLDPLTWRFKLRSGVRFSNGEAFDADAVLVTLDYLKSSAAAGSSVAREFTAVESGRRIDSHEVEIRTRYPVITLPALIAGMRIVAPAHWTRLGPIGFAKDPVGTGPFRVVNWESARIDLVAVKDAWRAPKLDRLEIYQVPDSATRLQGVLSGRLDIALVMQPEDGDQLEGRGGRLHVTAGGSVSGLSFITTKPGPLADVRVRQALNYAVDKAQLVDVLLAGHGRPAGQPATHYATGFNPEVTAYPYDPEKARSLLTAAGYPDGFHFIAEIVPNGGVMSGAVFTFVAQQLRAVGVEMEAQIIPVAQIIIRAVNGTFQGSAFSMEFNLKPTLDAERALAAHSCQRAVPWYCDESTMPLIEAVQREFDKERREELLRNLMQHYHEAAPMLYLYESVMFDAIGPRAQGYAPVNRRINYHEISVTD
jgi:peptide/nickel transport system substrate-binding protein